MKKSYVVLVAILSILITTVVMNNKIQTYKTVMDNEVKTTKKLRRDLRNTRFDNQVLSSQSNDEDDTKEVIQTDKPNDKKLKSFLELMLNYDNSNFVSRFDQADEYAEKQPISVFQVTAGKVEKPKVTISSKITNYKFYSDMKSNDTRGIAVVNVDFNYQGRTQHTINEYDVSMDSNGIVTKLTQRMIQK